ncbi:MAG: hypothetical protein ACE5DN_01395, partial [Flavobacteriales bacterium]
MALQIGPPAELRDVSIRLPASKSISNRALIIRCLSDGKSGIHNLSEAFDTTLLKKCLEGMYRHSFFDVADA